MPMSIQAPSELIDTAYGHASPLFIGISVLSNHGNGSPNRMSKMLEPMEEDLPCLDGVDSVNR
jgi:hypothetical protein